MANLNAMLGTPGGGPRKPRLSGASADEMGAGSVLAPTAEEEAPAVITHAKRARVARKARTKPTELAASGITAAFKEAEPEVQPPVVAAITLVSAATGSAVAVESAPVVATKAPTPTATPTPVAASAGAAAGASASSAPAPEVKLTKEQLKAQAKAAEAEKKRQEEQAKKDKIAAEEAAKAEKIATAEAIKQAKLDAIETVKREKEEAIKREKREKEEAIEAAKKAKQDAIDAAKREKLEKEEAVKREKREKEEAAEKAKQDKIDKEKADKLAKEQAKEQARLEKEAAKKKPAAAGAAASSTPAKGSKDVSKDVSKEPSKTSNEPSKEPAKDAAAAAAAAAAIDESAASSSMTPIAASSVAASAATPAVARTPSWNPAAMYGDYAEPEFDESKAEEYRLLATAGAEFLKHSKSGKPQSRLVFVTPELTLYWVESAAKRSKTDPKQCINLALAFIPKINVIKGKGASANFARSTAAKVPDEVCMSITGPKERNIDLECKSQQERDAWFAAIKFLLHEAQIAREKALVYGAMGP